MKQSTTHTRVGRSKTSGKNKSKRNRRSHWQTSLEGGLEAFTRLELMALLALGALFPAVPLLAQAAALAGGDLSEQPARWASDSETPTMALPTREPTRGSTKSSLRLPE
jgi:hypothetical protein